MCGIAGLVGDFVPGLAGRMAGLLAHRGPDGQGVFEESQHGVALSHARLAIIDLSAAAAQPMQDQESGLTLVYNGEIYNFRELRTELEGCHGRRFRTTSDTEVLLAGLAVEGVGFLGKLNGIFALACWDTRRRELLLARDPLGVKPLYVCEPRPGTMLFSSEIKALFAYPGLAREPDFETLREHLARGHASGTHTAFKGIRRVSPGTWLRWHCDDGRIERAAFWQPSWLPSERLEQESSHVEAAQSAPLGDDYRQAVERMRATIDAAVRRQMVADVPLGSFLSGGLDSSLITLLAAPEAHQDFQCFTITYPAAENRLDQFIDDTPYAFRVAQQVGRTQILLQIKPDVAELLPRLIWHMDEPVADPAIIACNLISRYARRNGTTVLLSGQGADELFGGYPRYQAMHLAQYFQSLPGFARRGLSQAARIIPGAREGALGARLRRVRRVLMELDLQPHRRFMAYCSGVSDTDIDRVFHPDLRSGFEGKPSAAWSLNFLDALEDQSKNRYLWRDLADYLPNHNLLYMDKMSMAEGVECRVPLLDLEIVRQVVDMPFEWKVSGLLTKRILRDAAQGIVPREILNRPKAGFGAPYRKWLRYDLKEMWEDLTSAESLRSRGWFDPAGVAEIRRLSQTSRQDLYILQWAILTTELWARVFLDGNPTLD